jgi:hypothetical protein
VSSSQIATMLKIKMLCAVDHRTQAMEEGGDRAAPSFCDDRLPRSPSAGDLEAKNSVSSCPLRGSSAVVYCDGWRDTICTTSGG